MRITIERAELLSAAQNAQSVVERRNTIPILANVLIEAEGGQASFRATDLDIEIRDIARASVEKPGAVTVNAVTLHEIVRKLPDGATVTLEDVPGESRIAVRAGRSEFTLATLPRQDFPEVASPDYQSEFAIPAAQLKRLFDKSEFAISTEETRYYLNGVYLHVAEAQGGKVLRAVATDGHRLARVDAELPMGGEDMPGVIVPRKTVKEVRRLLSDEDETIGVSVADSKIRFASGELTLTSKVIDGTFPDYARVIPSGNTRTMEVDADDFSKAVDRVATVSSERSRAVKMALDEDRLVLSVSAPDAGTAQEEMAVAYGDEKLEIGFNARYLREIAAQVDRENAVFKFNSPGDPALIQEGSDESAVYVVMPMRV